MKAVAFSVLCALGACVPSRSAVWSPVDRELERRLGSDVAPRSGGDQRVPAAVTTLLQKPLDRDAVVRIALATNRRLQMQYDGLGIAASDIASATVLAPTEVQLQYKVALDGDGSEVEVEVIQDILDLIQIPQRRGIAQAGMAAARARAVAATIELVARVEAAYVDHVAAQQELELRQSVLDAATASADIAQRMRAAGNIAVLGLERELDQREQARVELGRAQVDVELSREALNEVVGLSGAQTKWTITSRLAPLPAAAPALDSLEHDAVAASLELVAVNAEGEAAAGRVGVARLRSWLPELGVGVAATRRDGEWEAGPALSLGLPIFNQGQGPRARANAELRRSRNEAAATGVELRARARATRQRVLLAYAEARHLFDVILPRRQRIVDETLKQYNAMNASTFELLAARRDLVESGRQYIDAARRFWRAAADARALTRGAMPRGVEDARAQSGLAPSRNEGH